MRRIAILSLGLMTCVAAPASAQRLAQVNLTYDTYAAGIEVMEMKAFFGLGPWNYQLNVEYHTTGLVGVFYRGQQVNRVRGVWQDNRPQPVEFSGDGVWRGKNRRTLIDYVGGEPDVKELTPPQESERQVVPTELRMHTMDTLSALAQLMREVEATGHCETQVRTYDGRRVLEIAARTGGQETLTASSRSAYHGPALRCDFEGREIAGFLNGEDDAEHRQPLHGSAWLAPMLQNSPPLPVRIAFQTRWFGWATMYLTSAAPAVSPTATAHN